jgi:hypothetical protein
MANTIFLVDLYAEYINQRYHGFGPTKLVMPSCNAGNRADFTASLTLVKHMSKLTDNC